LLLVLPLLLFRFLLPFLFVAASVFPLPLPLFLFSYNFPYGVWQICCIKSRVLEVVISLLLVFFYVGAFTETIFSVEKRSSASIVFICIFSGFFACS